MNHQSTMDGKGIWLPGIVTARQMQMNLQAGVMYYFSSLRVVCAHNSGALSWFPIFHINPHVMIPKDSPALYVHGLDSQLPRQYMLAIEKERAPDETE